MCVFLPCGGIILVLSWMFKCLQGRKPCFVARAYNSPEVGWVEKCRRDRRGLSRYGCFGSVSRCGPHQVQTVRQWNPIGPHGPTRCRIQGLVKELFRSIDHRLATLLFPRFWQPRDFPEEAEVCVVVVCACMCFFSRPESVCARKRERHTHFHNLYQKTLD